MDYPAASRGVWDPGRDKRGFGDLGEAKGGLKATFVTPWYGEKVPGGAEAEALRTAQNLAKAGAGRAGAHHLPGRPGHGLGS